MVLSIIIPAYNVENVIRECLDSVISQWNEEIEIIIVNDGSNDNTDSVCKEYQQKYHSIKYICKNNAGVSNARNVGIENASGEWITFLDADDMLQENAIKKFMSADLREYQIVMAEYSSKIIKDQVLEKVTVREISSKMMKNAILNLPRYYTQICNQGIKIDGTINWTCWGKFFRRAFLVENHIKFVNDIQQGEDYVFCYEAYSYTKNIGIVNIMLYFYRHRKESLSRAYNPYRIENMLLIFEYFINLEKNILQNEDFNKFIVGRIVACCLLYFANEKNVFPTIKKAEDLKKICCIPYIEQALERCEAKRMCNSTKRNVQSIIIFSLIKCRRYRGAIEASYFLKSL